jgi:hypothetical protein
MSTADGDQPGDADAGRRAYGRLPRNYFDLDHERQLEWIAAFGKQIVPSAKAREEAAAQLAALVAELEDGNDQSADRDTDSEPEV